MNLSMPGIWQFTLQLGDTAGTEDEAVVTFWLEG